MFALLKRTSYLLRTPNGICSPNAPFHLSPAVVFLMCVLGTDRAAKENMSSATCWEERMKFCFLRRCWLGFTQVVQTH